MEVRFATTLFLLPAAPLPAATSAANLPRVAPATPLLHSGGDFHLFTDKSGTQGYILWTGMSKLPGYDHKIRISKLTPDFLGVTADAPYMFNDDAPTTTFNEAPSIFEREGVWYALFG